MVEEEISKEAESSDVYVNHEKEPTENTIQKEKSTKLNTNEVDNEKEELMDTINTDKKVEEKSIEASDSETSRNHDIDKGDQEDKMPDKEEETNGLCGEQEETVEDIQSFLDATEVKSKG